MDNAIDLDLEKLAKPFSDSDIDRINSDLSHAKSVAKSLEYAINFGNLDPATKAAIINKLTFIKGVIEAKLAPTTRDFAASEEKTTIAATEKPQKIEDNSQEKLIQRKTLAFLDARQKLLQTIKQSLTGKKIVAVDENGEEKEIDINPEEGLQKGVIGFAGKDQQALHAVAKEMNNFCDNIPPEMGHEIRRVEVVNNNGNKNYFFAIILPEGSNINYRDPFSMTEQEVRNSIEIGLKSPDNRPSSPNPQNNLQELSEKNQIAEFKKNRIRTFAVVDGDAKDLHNFNEAQIVDLWKSLVQEKKEKIGITAKRLDGQELQNSGVGVTISGK